MIISRKKNIKIYAWYSVLFLVLCLLCFGGHLLSHKSFIDTGDGIRQHYKALMYYGRYLRGILKNLFLHHNLIIPNWDFSLGEGADILQVLHYYVIGDPFTILSVFVPSRYTHYLYSLIIIAKIYCAGMAFISLCRYTDSNHNEIGILAGSLIYVFSLWTFINVQMHPFFLNPLITFPLLILGIEKIIRERKMILYIITLTITALSNFYFLYMHVILIILYVFIRLLKEYGKDYSKVGYYIALIFGCSMTGALLSAVIVVPTLYTFIIDSRTGGLVMNLLYPRSYYSQLPGLFVNTSRPYWTAIGTVSILLLSAALAFGKSRENKFLCILYGFCFIFLLFPVFGSLFNGMGYPTNRWIWAYLLLGCYTFTHLWPQMIAVSKKEKGILLLFVTVYTVLCLLCQKSIRVETFAGIGFMILYLFVLSVDMPFSKRQILIFCLIIVNIVSNAFLLYEYKSSDYLGRARNYGSVFRNVTKNDASVIRDYDQSNDFFRYSGSGLRVNGNMIAGVSSTQYYWSLTNPNIIQFRNDMESREISTIMYEGDDARASLLSLSAVRYYARKAGNDALIPYGYEYQNTKNQYEIYQNKNPLPLTFSYDSFILYDDWKKMNVIDRQESLLDMAVLDRIPQNIAIQQRKNRIYETPELQYSEQIIKGKGEIQDHSFIIQENGTTVILEVNGEGHAETYLEMLGLDIETRPQYDLYFDNDFGIYTKKEWDALASGKQKTLLNQKKYYEKNSRPVISFEADSGVSSSLTYYAGNDKKYADRHDFTIHFGYSETGIKKITLTFPEIGIYRFDSIHVYENPIVSYDERIAARKKDFMNNVDIETDKITGNIDLSSPKLLCFSIPYSEGWKAYVNGVQTRLLKTDVKYMALSLNEGHYDICLKYETPFLRTGVICSFAGAVLLIFIIIAEIKRNKSSDKKFSARTEFSDNKSPQHN